MSGADKLIFYSGTQYIDDTLFGTLYSVASSIYTLTLFSLAISAYDPFSIGVAGIYEFSFLSAEIQTMDKTDLIV